MDYQLGGLLDFGVTGMTETRRKVVVEISACNVWLERDDSLKFLMTSHPAYILHVQDHENTPTVIRKG